MIINSLDQIPGFVNAARNEPCAEEAASRLSPKLGNAAACPKSGRPVE